MAKYGKKAGEKVERAMHERKRGTLKTGRSGRKVKSRKQAIAIGLSEARRKEKRCRAEANSRTRRRPLSAPYLHRLAAQVLPERLERRGNDSFGVEAGLGVHRRRRILIYELVGQQHGAQLDAAVQHAAAG